MCGICGVVLTDRSRGVSETMLRSMCAAIEHRGPDDEGVFLDGAVGLAARRLSIIDLPGGHQPISNEDGTVTVTYNGEIYNYRELSEDLRARGHRFTTRTDTEVLVHAYEEFGAGLLQRLRGMFAFAIWDGRREELFAAVDRFGMKPLYWAHDATGIVFGSELSCVLASDLVPRELNGQAAAEYFALGYVPAPLSILETVRKLAPATHLRWKAGSVPSLETYWQPPSAQPLDGADPDEVRGTLLNALRDAVRCHLVSDVPVGAFLSGGIDSSVIVALMAEASTEAVRTFSIGFPDAEHDELDKARLVASRFGTNHHELVVEPGSVEVLPKLVAHFGEPFADSSALPTYHVSALAAKSVKVALSGDGGDELFVGYTTFRGLEVARMLERLPVPIRRALAGVSENVPRLPWIALADRVERTLKRGTDSLASPVDAYRSKVALTDPSLVLPLLTGDLRAKIGIHDPFRAIDASLAMSPNDGDPLERFLRVNLDVSLPSDMLVKVDRMSMARSLEVRVPLLDHVLAEHVLALPVRTRFPRWRLKGLLRDSVRDLIPAPILRQRKHGFTVPLTRWFRDDLNWYAREILLDRATARRGFFDLGRVGELLSSHASGRRNAGSLIWSLLMFELWCREVLD
ncbi:MAG: asparagine synthase (glutamine-hydrolyzing) [Gaiellaceae bacterium]